MKNNQGTNSVFTGSRIPAACWRVGFSRRRFAIAVMMGSLLFMSSGVLAQEERINREGRTSPLVVAAVTDTGVRFTAPGEIGEMRLEVFSSSGEKIFDSAFQRGNVLDWSPSSSAKELSAAMPDPYLCVLTLRDLSGGLDRRQILASLHSDKLTLAADPNRMSAPQAAALASTSNSPVEVETKWLTLPAEGAATLSTHNGTEGQVTSTAGALSFRTGDLFSGKDSERMRITPDGRVGIGTSTPQASLDVAGNINVGGIKFNDGTTLSSATGATKTTPDGTAAALVDGTGTTNRVTKWINGPAGTLGDSAVTEVSGRVGIGTPNPNFQLTMFGNDIGVQLISSGTGALASDGFRFGIDSTNKAFLFNQEATDMFFGTSALERMRISAGGNVGIGTTGPSHKLDVGGNINTSTQYNIGGQAVLRSSSVNANLFVGVNAGLNTVGFAHSNAFFGANAGLNNLGASNAFFGTSAGDTNTTGSFNTMIGTGSDVASTGLTNATAIGQRALVSQSNSLVLGSINGQNGATADTNVGVGTTAPLAKLHLVGTSTTATSPIAILQSSGDEVPLSFRFGATDAARIRTTDFGNLVFATLNGTDKNMFFRAGDDSGTDMFIQSSTGNVGIGTITPANRLEVKDGAVLSSGASGGRFTANNPNNQSAAVNLDWLNDTARIRYGGTGVGATNGFRIQGQGDVTKLAIFDNGNMVLGTEGSTSHNLFVNGKISANFPGGGIFHLCKEDVDQMGDTIIFQISECSSSIRYKKDVQAFTPGLGLLSRLRPVSFSWKKSGITDVGLIAEEVERVDPRLVTYNGKGEVEGVKYDRIGVVLLNAVQEQQTQIKSQQAQIKEQRQQLRVKDNRISSLEQRLAKYESSLAVYEARLASLEKSVVKVIRPTRRIVARTPGSKRGRSSARKAD